MIVSVFVDVVGLSLSPARPFGLRLPLLSSDLG